VSRRWDWRASYERRYGPLPECMGGPAAVEKAGGGGMASEAAPTTEAVTIPEERSGTAREAPGTRGDAGPVESVVADAGPDVGVQPAFPHTEGGGARPAPPPPSAPVHGVGDDEIGAWGHEPVVASNGASEYDADAPIDLEIRPPRKWPADRTARLRWLAEQERFTASMIADELGMPRNSVIGKCAREGIRLDGRPRAARTRSWPRERIDRLREIAGAGGSQAGAARALGVSPASAGWQARKHGIVFGDGRKSASGWMPGSTPKRKPSGITLRMTTAPRPDDAPRPKPRAEVPDTLTGEERRRIAGLAKRGLGLTAIAAIMRKPYAEIDQALDRLGLNRVAA